MVALTSGALLAGLWSVWLAGRLLLAFGGNLPDWLVQGVNLAFLPLVMIDAGWRVWKARQKRQLMIARLQGLSQKHRRWRKNTKPPCILIPARRYRLA